VAILIDAAPVDAGAPPYGFPPAAARPFALPAVDPVPPYAGPVTPTRAPRLSRRTLLASGGFAAATAAAGIIVGERFAGPSNEQHELRPVGGAWTAVALVSDLPEGTARTFDTGSVRGFVVNRGGTIAALSGVCTHLGCLLQLNAAARRLDCPCHSAAFGFDGNVLFKHMPDSLPPLPLMESRIRDGHIEVLTV
jgi:cytochrome b6-f complex iron-sulfur subunit